MKTKEQKRFEAVERQIKMVSSMRNCLAESLRIKNKERQSIFRSALVESKSTLKQIIGAEKLPTALQYEVNLALHSEV